MRSLGDGRLGIVLLALLMLSAPQTLAIHLADEAPGPPEAPRTPEAPGTGFVELDQRLGELQAESDDAIARFNEAVQEAYGSTSGVSPIRPIPLLEDAVGPDQRHGGIGPWNTSSPWHRADHSDQEWTWWFGDEEPGNYPSEDALLLSPILDLDTLGGYQQILHGWDMASRNSSLDLYTLLVTHQFSFAAVADLGRGLDGGRVELFTRFDTDAYDHGGHVLTPEPPTGIEDEAEYADRVEGLDGPGFTGTADWNVSAFDLTPWAGHQVRIGFRVGTIPFTPGPGYFGDERLFPTDAPRGWHISDVQVKAPAMPSNLKVERFTAPGPADDESGLVEITPRETVRAQAPIVNLGTTTETVDIRYTVTDHRPRTNPGPLAAGSSNSTRPDGGTLFHEATGSITLAPGEVHTFEDDGWAADTGRGRDRIVWLSIEADARNRTDTLGLEPRPAIQQLPIEIRGQRDVNLDLDAEPMVAAQHELRQVTLRLDNAGTLPTSGHVKASIHEVDDNDRRRNVTERILDDGDLRRAIQLKPNQTDAITWTIQLPEPGRYDFKATVQSTGGDFVLHQGLYADVGVGTPSVLQPTGQPRFCKDVPGWDCERPEIGLQESPDDAPDRFDEITGSQDGLFWVSGASLLTATPTGAYTAACPFMVAGGSDPAQAPSDCLQTKDIQAAIRLLQDKDPGARDLHDELEPGYDALRLEVRYRASHISLDNPPTVEIEASYRDVTSSILDGLSLSQTFGDAFAGGVLRVQGPGLAIRPTAPLESTVQARIELPVSNGTENDGALATAAQYGWRTLEVDLDERLREAAGLNNAWDLALQELRITVPEGRLLLDELTVDGIPLNEPERGRVPLLHTTGGLDTEVGHWQNRGAGGGEVTLATPLVRGEQACTANQFTGSCWARHEQGDDEDAREWRLVEGRDGDPFWQIKGNPNTDERLITPPTELGNTTAPSLVLDHSFATPASPNNGWRLEGDQLKYQLWLTYLVEVQYLQADGTWSPFYLLEPETGYPTPEMVDDLGTPRWPRHDPPDLRPGDGFYWPNGTIEITHPTLDGVATTKEVRGSGPQRHAFPLDRAPDGLGPPIPLTDRTVRFAFHVFDPADTQDPGGIGNNAEWKLENIALWPQERLAHNVGIQEASLNPAFNLSRTNRSIGPGAQLPIEVVVGNDGLFDEDAVRVTLTVESDGREVDDFETVLAIPSGSNRTQTFVWNAPDRVDDRQRFDFRVDVSLPDHVDMDLFDNTIKLPHVQVHTRPRVSAATEIAPSPGAADVLHNLATTVENPGNVPLHGVEVDRTIWRLGEGRVLVRQDSWSIDGELDPTSNPLPVGGTELPARHTSIPSNALPDRWLPGDPGTYLLETVVRGVPITEDADDEDAMVERAVDEVIDVLEPVLTDGFEGDRRGGLPGTSWTTEGDGWHKRTDTGFRSSASWWIGGAEGYPHETDARLESPVLDLSAAKSAFIGIATNYSTEPFYDGAVIEVTTDGGETWTPVEPGKRSRVTGYPSPLSPANPAASSSSGITTPGAFSGSMPAEGRLDGWHLYTFPLSQVGTLSQRGLIADLTPPGEDNGSLEKLGTSFTRASWKLGTGEQADQFVVQNLTLDEPRPQTGGLMWYTGSQGDRDAPINTTLTLDLPAPADGNRLEITFRDWRPGTVPRDLVGTGGKFRVEATSEVGSFARATTVATDPSPDTAWTPRRAVVETNAPPGSTILVNFSYDSQRYEPVVLGDLGAHIPTEVQRASNIGHNRGWAIDEVNVTEIDGEGKPVGSIGEDLSEQDPAWSVVDHLDRPDVPEWHPAQSGVATEGAWSASRPPSFSEHHGSSEPAWVLAPSSDPISLAGNLDTRLVTPTVDLRGVASTNISLLLDHEYNFQLRDRSDVPIIGDPLVEGGVIEVQVFNETRGAFDAWRTLFPEPVDPAGATLRAPDSEDPGILSDCPTEPSSGSDDPFHNHECVTYRVQEAILDPVLSKGIGYPYASQLVHPTFEHFSTKFEWVGISGGLEALKERNTTFTYLYTGESEGVQEDAFNLSWLAGKRFRLGLHAWANPHESTTTEPEHWIVHQLGIETDLFQGDRVQFRARFGSDRSIAGEHVAIDAVSVGAVNYDRNLALGLDGEEGQRTLQPGSTLTLNATIQNRGLAPRGGFGLRVDAPGIEEPVTWTSPQSSPSRPDAPGQGESPGVIGPFSLGPAGSGTDAIRVPVQIQLPPETNATHANVTVRLVEITDPDRDRTVPLGDDVTGNKEIRIPLRIGVVQDVDVDIGLDPDRVGVGEATTITLALENAGSVSLAPRTFINVTDEDGTLVHTHPVQLALDPSAQAQHVRSIFTPTSPGMHTVRAVVEDGPVRVERTLELPVDRSTSLISTSWEAQEDLASWTITRQAVSEQCRNVQPVDEQPIRWPSSDPAEWERFNDSGAPAGDWYMLFGEPIDSRSSPPASQDAGLISSAVDLSELDEPRLTILHRPHFMSLGAGAVIEAQVVDPSTGQAAYTGASESSNCRTSSTRTPNTAGWFMLTPDRGYERSSQSYPGVPPAGGGGPSAATASDISPLGDGHPILGGNPGTWIQDVFDLREQRLRTPSGDPVVLEEEVVKFRLRATTREATRIGDGWDVDNIVVGDGAVSVFPSNAVRTIVDGAVKDMRLTIENPGTRQDTYQVEVVEGGTTLPLDWIDLPRAPVVVPAEGSRPVNFTLRVPVSPDNQQATYTLRIAASSVIDPGIVDVSTLKIEVVPSLHANLVPRLSSSADQIESGSSMLLSTTVLNTGLTTSTRAEARLWVKAPGATVPETIATLEVPAIPPSRGGAPGSAQLTANFTAPTWPHGSYEFGVDVDPENRIVEFDEADNTDRTTVDIVPLQRPDLRIGAGDIDVRDLSGQPLEAAEPGDIVQVIAGVTNAGNQPASNVRVSLSIGPDPVGELTVAQLAPGDTRRFTFTVFAPAESTEITVQARTFDPELDESNNAATVGLPVRSPSFSLSTEDGSRIALTPGELTSHELILENTGDKDALLSLSTAEDAFQIDAAEGEILLKAGQARTLEVRITAAPTIPPGNTTIPFKVTRLEAQRESQLELPAELLEHRALTLDVADPSVPPGAFPLSVEIENRGNLEESVTLLVDLPVGWEGPGNITERLGPGAQRSLEIPIAPPNTTQAGGYPVEVQAVARSGTVASTVADVTIEPLARVDLQTEAIQVGTSPVIYQFNLTNEGNIPATPALDVIEPPSGWSLRVVGGQGHLAPGERAQGELVFERLHDDAPGLSTFLLQTRLDPDRPVAQQHLNTSLLGRLNAQAPDLVLGDVTRSPSVDVQGGERVAYSVEVHNEGRGPAAPVQVQLYRDGRLADLAELAALAPGTTERVNLSLEANGGLQSIVIVADDRERLLDPDRSNNAAGLELTADQGLFGRLPIPSTGPVLLVALLGLLVMFRGRRRKG